ncbi:hypothetical protein [Lactovum odontotermitis]
MSNQKDETKKSINPQSQEQGSKVQGRDTELKHSANMSEGDPNRIPTESRANNADKEK